MLSYNKPLPQTMLTKIYIDIWLKSYTCVVYVFPSEVHEIILAIIQNDNLEENISDFLSNTVSGDQCWVQMGLYMYKNIILSRWE